MLETEVILKRFDDPDEFSRRADGEHAIGDGSRLGLDDGPRVGAHQKHFR